MVRRQTFTARVAMTRGERSGLADNGALDVMAETAYDIRTTGRTVDELTCSSGHFLKILRFLLDSPQKSRFSSPPPQQPFHSVMSRICSIRGSVVRSGGRIHRSGLAKKKGGIGRHVTKVVKRKVSPNLQDKRIWVPEFGHYVRLRLSCKAIKTITKNGALNTLIKAGLV